MLKISSTCKYFHFAAKQICEGDEGGGLVFNNHVLGKVLVGIYSGTAGGCSRFHPAIYTPVYRELNKNINFSRDTSHFIST